MTENHSSGQDYEREAFLHNFTCNVRQNINEWTKSNLAAEDKEALWQKIIDEASELLISDIDSETATYMMGQFLTKLKNKDDWEVNTEKSLGERDEHKFIFDVALKIAEKTREEMKVSGQALDEARRTTAKYAQKLIEQKE